MLIGVIYINLILKELKISSFSLGKFFGKVENGQKKCPKTERGDSGSQKHVLAASGHQKNNFQFVTIIFLFFCGKVFRDFFCCLYINGCQHICPLKSP